MAINPNEINIKNIVELIQSSSIKDNDLLVVGQGIYARKSTVLELYNKFGVPSILTSLNSLQFQINQLNNTVGNSVLYSPQVKTLQQKADARNNLDVYSRSETQTVVNSAIVNLGNVVNSVNGVNVDNTDPKNPIIATFRPLADYQNDMLLKADIDGNLTTGGIWFQDQVLTDRFANYKQVWTALTNNTIEWGNIELDKHVFLVDDINGLKIKVGGTEGAIWNTLNLTNVSQLNNDAGYLQANDLDGFIYDVTYNSVAHTITFYQQNEPNIVIDLPIEQLIKGVQLVGNDLVFTFEDGSTVTVPLNTLLVGVVKSVNGLTPNSQGEIVLNITDIPNLSIELANKLDIRMAGLVSNLTQPEKDAILSKLGVVNNVVQVLGLSGNTITLSNGGGSISLNIANIGGLQTALDGKANINGYYPSLSVGNSDNSVRWNGAQYVTVNHSVIDSFMTYNNASGFWGYSNVSDMQSALGINTSWNLHQVVQNGNWTSLPINVNDLILNNDTISNPKAIGFYDSNTGSTQRILTGGLLTSDSYTDASLIPANGIYVKGNAKFNGSVYINKGIVLEDNSVPQDWSIYQDNVGINFYVTGGAYQGDVFKIAENGRLTTLLDGTSADWYQGYIRSIAGADRFTSTYWGDVHRFTRQNGTQFKYYQHGTAILDARSSRITQGNTAGVGNYLPNAHDFELDRKTITLFNMSWGGSGWGSSIISKGWDTTYNAWMISGSAQPSDVEDDAYFRQSISSSGDWHPARRLWSTRHFSDTDIANWNTAYNNIGQLSNYVSKAGDTMSGNLYAPKVLTNLSTLAFGVVSNQAGLGLYNGGVVQYGISTNAGGGMDIMANQDSQPIRFWAGSDNTNPNLVASFEQGSANFYKNVIIPNATAPNHAVAFGQLANYALSSAIPTNVSQLVNDAGYITASALSGYVPTSRTLTINGTTFDLSQNRTWTIPIPAQVNITQGAGITVTGTYPNITITNSSPNATHTGDVTGATALTIANGVVTNAKMANMSANTFKGRLSTAGAPQDLTVAQMKTALGIAPPNNGTFTVSGDGVDIVGTGSTSANASANTSSTLSLSTATKNDITAGKNASTQVTSLFSDATEYFKYNDVSGGGSVDTTEAFFNLVNPTTVSGLTVDIGDHYIKGARLVLQGVTGMGGIVTYKGKFIMRNHVNLGTLTVEGQIDREFVWDANANRWREVF